MDIIQAATAAFKSTIMMFVLGLVMLDTLTGMVAAARKGLWDWGKVGDWLRKDLGGYYLGAGLYQTVLNLGPLLGLDPTVLSPIGPAAAIVVLAASIRGNFKEITGPPN